MSDSRAHQVAPVPPISGARAVQPVSSGRLAVPASSSDKLAAEADVAASTGGNLPAAYAQFVVNEDTHDVVIRIRDASTDRVISEYPSKQVEALAAYMRKYSDDLARARAARASQNQAS